jgi:hypothetical protein
MKKLVLRVIYRQPGEHSVTGWRNDLSVEI